ncbi:EscT/YscT/HrcT family type III secretion system export apparatus protein [Salmonella enterica]|nr:EscT/YscT/HrcT family type III secretion system export apparatus protein [Salmonella enterica]EFQ6618158.1 EscT/YscT/HrcT family type III secretion system export apparatus protein [Salmonella enterica]
MQHLAMSNHYATLLFFSLMRPLGIFVLMPLLTSKNLSGSLIRNAVILAFMLPVLHGIEGASFFSGPQHIDGHFLLALVSELVIGLIIGFVAAIPFWAIGSAGFLIDTMRGSSMGSIFNPTLGESTSLLSVLFSQLLTVLFFVSGGMNHLLTALYTSYVLIAPGEYLSLNQAALRFIEQQWDLLSELLLCFSIPAAAVMLLTDVGMGLLNRSAQQLNVFFLAMSIKSILALLMLMITLGVALHKYHLLAFSALTAVARLWGH